MKKLIVIIILSLIISFINKYTYSADNFKLFEPGTANMINYSDYGKFEGLGTEKYKYQILKKTELEKASGTGVYPNTSALKDPEYIKLVGEKKLTGSQWNFLDNKNYIINFYKWATVAEDPGVKQYYIALLLERMGLLKQAIKGYYALAVFFPKTVSYTYWGSPFYLGQLALDKIEILLRRHPELGLKLVDAKITVENAFDNDIKNDKFYINPGRIIKVKPEEVKEKKITFSSNDIVKTIGGQEVKLVQYKNGHWQLLVENKPYMVKAVAYTPNKVGLSPDRGTLNPTRDWQNQDFNHNGTNDSLYESWIDEKLNDKQDAAEPRVGDAKLLYEMGCNTLRIYNHVINKDLFRDLYNKYKIRLIIGDMAGGYAIESGASWEQGTDYENPDQIKTMLGNIEKMVMDNKDEPYTLFWVLGNENDFGVGNNSDKKPEAFFKFINTAAKLIHKLDPNHPVAICNGDLKFLDLIAKFAPDIDIMGANAYRGVHGFGRTLFQNVKDFLDKPVLITEYGCSAYADPEAGFTEKEILDYQAEYHKNAWEDIMYHSAGSGVGNVLGGVVFEWLDEWWKANSDLPKKIQIQKKEWYAKRSATYKNLQPDIHDIVPQFGAPFIDGWSYEEWLGLFSQGNGKNSPFERQKRPVYDMYKKIWNE